MPTMPTMSPVDTFLIQNLWGLLLLIGALVVWGIRLEGRVNQVKAALDEHYTRKVETAELRGQVDSQNRALVDLSATMIRVEKKVDQLLVNHHHDER